jgi:drug/metabolite transporter (DMT)-like permease
LTEPTERAEPAGVVAGMVRTESGLGSGGILWGLVAPLACVAVISTGQLLFKLAAGLIDFRRPLAEPQGLMILGVALVLYAGATLLWVMVLKHTPLSRIYPVMALSFVLTPLGATLILKEPVSGGSWTGIGLILAGLIVIGRSPAG